MRKYKVRFDHNCVHPRNNKAGAEPGERELRVKQESGTWPKTEGEDTSEDVIDYMSESNRNFTLSIILLNGWGPACP